MTERLIPFDLDEWRKRPQDLRHAEGSIAVESAECLGGIVAKFDSGNFTAFAPRDFVYLRLTAPAPKRVEVRASLWASGRITLWSAEYFEVAEAEDQFVRWLTNWHIEDGKVFVEVE